jgi:hypothetical protein
MSENTNLDDVVWDEPEDGAVKVKTSFDGLSQAEFNPNEVEMLPDPRGPATSNADVLSRDYRLDKTGRLKNREPEEGLDDVVWDEPKKAEKPKEDVDSSVERIAKGYWDKTSKMFTEGMGEVGDVYSARRKEGQGVLEAGAKAVGSAAVGTVAGLIEDAAEAGDVLWKGTELTTDTMEKVRPEGRRSEELDPTGTKYRDQQRVSEFVNTEGIRKFVEGYVPGAYGFYDAISAPISAAIQQAGEENPWAGVAAEVGVTALPFVGARTAGKRRAARKAAEAPPKPITGTASDILNAPEKPTMELPADPVDLDIEDVSWDDMSRQLSGEDTSPTTIDMLKEEAHEPREPAPIEDANSDLLAYRNRVAKDRTPEEVKAQETADVDAADSAWSDLTKTLTGVVEDPDTFESFPDEALSRAMDEAVVEPEANPTSPHKPLSTAFLNAMRKKQGGWYSFWHSTPKIDGHTQETRQPFFQWNMDKKHSGEGATVRGAGAYASLTLGPQRSQYLDSFKKMVSSQYASWDYRDFNFDKVNFLSDLRESLGTIGNNSYLAYLDSAMDSIITNPNDRQTKNDKFAHTLLPQMRLAAEEYAQNRAWREAQKLLPTETDIYDIDNPRTKLRIALRDAMSEVVNKDLLLNGVPDRTLQSMIDNIANFRSVDVNLLGTMVRNAYGVYSPLKKRLQAPEIRQQVRAFAALVESKASPWVDTKDRYERPYLVRGDYDAEAHEMIDHDLDFYKQPQLYKRIQKMIKNIFDEQRMSLEERFPNRQGWSLEEADNLEVNESAAKMANRWSRLEDVLQSMGMDEDTVLKELVKVGIKGHIFNDGLSRNKAKEQSRKSRNIIMLDPERMYLSKWYDMNTGKLIAEDTRRGAAARSRLLQDAANFEDSAEISPKQVEDARDIMFKGTASARNSTVMDASHKAAMQQALTWVGQVLPRMLSFAKGGVHAVDFRDLQMANAHYHSLQGVMTTPLQKAAVLKKYPQLERLLSTSENHWQLVSAKFPADLTGSMAEGQAAWHFPLNNNGRNGIDGLTSTVLLNTRVLTRGPANPVKWVGAIVHELAHARHWRNDVIPELTRKEDRGNKEVVSRTTEKYARQAEETATIKFSEMLKDELKARGLYSPHSIYTKDKTIVDASLRASTTSMRNEGKMGSARRSESINMGPKRPRMSQTGSVDFSTYVPYFREIVAGGQKLADNIAAWWHKTPGAPNLNEAMTGMPDIKTEDFIEVLGAVEQDMRHDLGFRTATNAAANPLINAGKVEMHKARMVALHFLNKIKKAIADEHAANFDIMQVFQKFEGHYGVKELGAKSLIPFYRKSSLTEKESRSFAKDTDIALWFEHNPDKWFDPAKQNWYPTEQELTAKGMSPESAKIWRGVFDELEKLWTSLETAMNVNGRRVVDRVPGYLPHITRGAYRAIAYIFPTNGGPKKYLAEIGAPNKFQANENLALLKQHVQRPGVEFLVEEPKPGSYDIGAILEGLRRARDITENMKGLATLNKIIEEGTAKGVIAHVLDRNNPTKFGHELSRVTQYGHEFGLNRTDMKEAVETFRDYAKSVNSYVARARLVSETLGPLDVAGYLDHPNLHRFIMDFFKSYVKIDNNNMVDTFIRDVFAKMGRNPNILHNALGKMHSGFAKYFLLYNWAFLAVNSAQATASFPVMLAKSSQLRNFGATQIPSIPTAISKGSARLSNVWSDEGTMRDPELAWGKKHGYLDPQVVEVLDPGKKPDLLAQLIDKRTRTIAFAYGYEFWSQIKLRDEALRLAGEFSNEVSVPYSKQAGAAQVLNKIPVVGRAMAMFSTYPMHVFTMLGQHARLGAMGVRNKNARAAIEGFGAGISFGLLQVALFGAAAFPLYEAFDWLINTINDFYGKNVLPTGVEVARSIDKATGMKGVAEFGVPTGVAQTLGATMPDISGSASGVMPRAPSAFYRAGESVFVATLLGLKWAAGKEPTKQEVYDVVRTMPKQWGGPIELFLRDYPLTTSQRDVHDQGRARSDLEQLFSLAGLRSLQEKSEFTTDRLDLLQERRIQEQLTKLAQRAQDAKDITPEIADRLTELAIAYQQDPRTFIREFQNFMVNRELSPDMKRALKARTMSGAGSYERFLNRQNTETTRAPQ